MNEPLLPEEFRIMPNELVEALDDLLPQHVAETYYRVSSGYADLTLAHGDDSTHFTAMVARLTLAYIHQFVHMAKRMHGWSGHEALEALAIAVNRVLNKDLDFEMEDLKGAKLEPIGASFTGVVSKEANDE